MKVAAGGLVRATSGLNFRAGRGTSHERLAVLVADALLHPLEGVVDGWVHARLYGWQLGKSGELLFDPYATATKKATLTGGVVSVLAKEGEWNFVSLDGYVSAGYVVVVDGPK